MRKVLISLLLLLFVVQTNAQVKASADAAKALDKAKLEVQNPKKASNPVSWVKLGTAYADCYDAPIKGIWQGASQMEAKMLLKDQQIFSSAQEEKNGRVFSVDQYADKALYYDENGALAAWIVKEPAIKDVNPLVESFNAFKKANELDAKGSQKKVVTEQLKALQNRFVNEAMSYYTLGENKLASDNFELSLGVSSHPLINQVDSMIMYYTAVTAAMANDNARAIKYLEECTKISYDQDGDVYSTLSECYKKSGDTVKAKEVLNTGFVKYPTSQSILVALINLYMETNDDTNKLLELLKSAQSNEPNNPSLYYAEGNVYLKFNDYAKAIEAYKKSGEIDPKYFWAPFSEGKTYYDQAVAIQEKANMESDDDKYMELLKQLDESLESSLAPLERAFGLTEDSELKAYVAELLKNVYFRFRDKNDEYKANYEKYNTFLQNK